MAYLNETGLSHFWGKIKNKFVAKEVGKGLSTNDYSDSEKLKVAETSERLVEHFSDRNNPHVVTAAQVGLGRVNNTADKDKTVAKAGQLTNARKISLADGAIGTATSFDGSTDVSIPVTDIKESYLSWGGKLLNKTSVFDDLLIGNITNCFSFLPMEGVTIKSSRDGGLNWKTETPVPQIFDVRFGNFPVGIEAPYTTNDRVQIIIDNNICRHSCTLEKILLKGYFSGMKVKATLEVFNNENLIKTNTIDFSSEWYSIPLSVSFYYNYKIYLTLEITEVTNTNGSFYFYKMIGLGKPNNATSTMAKTGLLYEYDKNQNASFPAQIKATEFIEGGTSLKDKYATKADTSEALAAAKAYSETIASGKADIDTVPTNWINGSKIGSLKMLGAKDDTDTYTLAPHAIAEGLETSAAGFYSHAEGHGTTAKGQSAHAEGSGTVAAGQGSHAEGDSSHATKWAAHAEGYNTKAEGDYSHAEGSDTQTNANGSHAEGYATQSNAAAAHAEGYQTRSNAIGAHTEGFNSYANGWASHAEGQNCSFGEYSHAEGQHNSIYIKLTGAANSKQYTVSYIEVDMPIASGMRLSLPKKNKFNIPIVMGSLTSVTLSETLSDTELVDEIVYVEMNGAYGKCSHVEGTGTIAFGHDQHVEGQYNIPDSAEISKYIHIAGNGTKTEPSNAYTLDWTGIGWFARDIYIGGTAYDDGEAEKVSTENYVDSKFNQINSISASRINQICGH